MNNKKITFIILVALSALVSGCSSKQAATVEEKQTTEVETQKVKYIEAFGKVMAEELVITNKYAGLIKNINVKEGERIDNSQKIIEMNFEEEMKSIVDKIEEKQLELKSIESEMNTYALELKKYYGELNDAKEILKEKEENSKKQEILYNSGAISKEEYDNSKKEIEECKKNIAKIDLNISITRKKSSNADLVKVKKAEVIKAEIEKYKSSLEEIKSYSESEITTNSTNMIVNQLYVKNGEAIKAMSKLATLSDLSKLRIEADVPEEFIKDVKLKDKVIVTMSYDSSKQYEGEISYIWDMAVIRNGETVVPVEILLNDMKDIKLNYNVDVKIEK